ncbi:GTPase Era, mitochondrial [Eurytemora carolleeae]|uniref:GTPase Era, mitochondrial n=1 Tax=Eurytemora carolleeae TaxID=1294199 RepID=UPI000C78FE56|nr:GTPase Era, mitochondrial [Eurytemora carolleeae]|eukprot:XP_023323160.1 GTPase Era, mitochondrial-like [Eurytemora affinis]
MLRKNIVQLFYLPRRTFLLYSPSSGKSIDELENFNSLPEIGNSNTNPVKHKHYLENNDVRTDGKFLNISILGIPNSGKSTLINRLMGKQVCPPSCKNNTTRRNARAVLTQGSTQLVFLDTPGVVDEEEARRFKLEDSLLKDPELSCQEADLLLVLHDVSNRYVREGIDKKVLRLLCKYQHRVPCILVLNKIDSMPESRRIFDLIRKLTCNRLDNESGEIKISKTDPKWSVESYLKHKKRRSLLCAEEERMEVERRSMESIINEAKDGMVEDERALELVQGLLGWPGFRDVFSISALKGDGVKDLRDYLLDSAKAGSHRFSSNILLDVDPRQAVLDIVKSKLLNNLEGDIPRALSPILELWQFDEEKSVLRICVSIQTRNSRQSSNLIGTHGKKIRQIAREVEKMLEEFFDHRVVFTIQPILHKDTRKLNPQNEEPKEKTVFV